MKILDLQIRIARKLASGRGSMQMTQTDLDVFVQSGAYAMLCEAATEELKRRSPHPADAPHIPLPAGPISIRGFDMPDEVAAAVALAKTSVKHPARSRSTAPVLTALIKSTERR